MLPTKISFVSDLPDKKFAFLQNVEDVKYYNAKFETDFTFYFIDYKNHIIFGAYKPDMGAKVFLIETDER